jgi:hypothetical protein
VDTKCGVRPRELESAPLARLSPEHSPDSLPTLTQECNKETLFSKGWCVLQEGGFELYSYYFRVGTELSVGCTQVRWLCLSFMPRESTRGCQVGPAGLGMQPSGHRLCVDALDSLLRLVAVVWLQWRWLEAGWPLLGWSAWLWLGSGLGRSRTLFTGSTLLLKRVWVSILWFVLGIEPILTWFKPFDLNL